jgi:hypothetical protein
MRKAQSNQSCMQFHLGTEHAKQASRRKRLDKRSKAVTTNKATIQKWCDHLEDLAGRSRKRLAGAEYERSLSA